MEAALRLCCGAPTVACKRQGGRRPAREALRPALMEPLEATLH